MSDDEEMSDLSQAITQSGSITFTSLSLSNQEPDNEPWGRILIFKIHRKRFGIRSTIAKFQKVQESVFDLVNDKTTFGRNGDCNISNLIDPMKVNEISGHHFTITKQNVQDPLCPVFLEDSSYNGTYFRPCNEKVSRGFDNKERIDERVKRRIMAHKDVIFIEKRPTICFEFQSFQLSSNDLPKDIYETYHIGKVLGSGACGIVYFAQNRQTCQPYAVKYTKSDKNENVKTIEQEVEILKRLKHPCILHLHKVRSFIDSIAIVIDFMKGGDLLGRLQSCGHFSESLAKFVFYQICCGVEYLHSQHVTHRDLKPENILLATTDKYTLVKVSDFGLSKCVNTTNSVLQTQCGTIIYMAPEVTSAPYTNKVDIWSMGVILFNCFTGRYPFSHRNDFQITFDDGVWKNVSADAKEIIRHTLTKDVNARPSAKELLTQRHWLSKNDQIVQRALDIIANPTNEKENTPPSM